MATTGFTAAQQAKINAAVSQSVQGISGGKSFGAIQNDFASYLQSKATDAGSNPDGLAFTQAQISTINAGFASVEAHGASFREQGNAATFASAWEQQLHALFPTVANAIVMPTPAAAPTPVVVTPPAAKPIVNTPPPIAATTTTTGSATDPTGVAASASIAAQIAAALVAATGGEGASTDPTTGPNLTITPLPASPASYGPVGTLIDPMQNMVPTTATATALGAGSTAAGDTSTTGTTTATTPATADNPADDATIQTLQAALASSGVAGSGSVAGGTGVADTSGETPLTTATTSTTGPDLPLILLVVGLVAVGGFIFWRMHAGKGKHPAPAPGAA